MGVKALAAVRSLDMIPTTMYSTSRSCVAHQWVRYPKVHHTSNLPWSRSIPVDHGRSSFESGRYWIRESEGCNRNAHEV